MLKTIIDQSQQIGQVISNSNIKLLINSNSSNSKITITKKIIVVIRRKKLT